MPNRKFCKRGKSLYLQKWNRNAKKFINTCRICGYRGYSPVIDAAGFCDETRNAVIYRELKRTLPRLDLDELGRCKMCAKAQDENDGRDEK